MNKKIFLSISFLIVCAVAIAENPCVTFLLRNGQKVGFVFSKKPSVAVSDTDLTISLAGIETVVYPYDDVQYVAISDNTGSGIETIVNDKPCQNVVFTWQDGQLLVSGLSPMEQVNVYAINGILCFSDKARSDGSLKISLSNLSKGIYIVHTQSGISYKLFNN